MRYPPGPLENEPDDVGEPIPVLTFGFEVDSALGGEFVEFGFAAGLRRSAILRSVTSCIQDDAEPDTGIPAGPEGPRGTFAEFSGRWRSREWDQAQRRALMRRSRVPCGRSNLSSVFIPVLLHIHMQYVEGQGVYEKLSRSAIFSLPRRAGRASVVANRAKSLSDVGFAL